MTRDRLAFVHLLVSAQVGYDGEVSTTALDIASKRLLARVAVHVCLKRAWSRKSLVANLALMLLLRIGGHLG